MSRESHARIMLVAPLGRRPAPPQLLLVRLFRAVTRDEAAEQGVSPCRGGGLPQWWLRRSCCSQSRQRSKVRRTLLARCSSLLSTPLLVILLLYSHSAPRSAAAGWVQSHLIGYQSSARSQLARLTEVDRRKVKREASKTSSESLSPLS